MLKVEYDGRDITADISVAQAWLDTYATGHSDSLTIRLNDTRNLWDVWSPAEGDEITVSDGAATSGRMDVISVQPESSQMVIKALAMPKDAGHVKRAKSWEQVHLSQLIAEICNRYGLSYEAYGFTDRLYDYVEQADVSDFEFLSRRCALEGLGMLVHDRKLVIYDGAYMDAQSPVGSLMVAPGDDYRLLSDGFVRFGSCKVTDGRVEGTFTADASGKELSVILNDRMTSTAEANRFAKGMLRHKNRQASRVRVTTDSFLQSFAPGSVLDFSAKTAASWDGAAFVERMRFDFYRLKTMVELRPVIEGY